METERPFYSYDILNWRLCTDEKRLSKLFIVFQYPTNKNTLIDLITNMLTALAGVLWNIQGLHIISKVNIASDFCYTQNVREIKTL